MIKIKTKTLSRDYFIFAAIVAVVIISISTGRTIQTYNNLNHDRELRYESESKKISDQLEESFNYLENFMRLIANDISRLNDPTPERIAPYLERSWPRIKDNDTNYFAWSVLDFSNPQGKILASSISGVLEEEVMLPKNRAWVKGGAKQPGKLIFSAPDIGVLTNQYILPVGFGIKDRFGRYIGAISISFNINSLTRKVETPIRKETSFIILDKDKHIISQSSGNKKKFSDSFFADKLAPQDMPATEGKLDKPLKMGDISYSYYKKMANYPFIILVGDNAYYQSKETNRLLSPRIEQSIILGIFFLGLLYVFQRKIIQPVVALSDAAKKLSKGDTNFEMPKTDIHEYQVLSQQLGNIKEIISRLTEAQANLEEALKAKSNFLSNMSHEFRTPLNAVIGFSETIKKKIFGEIGNEKYSEYIEDINDQGQYLLKLIEDILDASKLESGKLELYEEPFSFNRLIKDAVKTVAQRAEAKRIQLIPEMSDDLPYIKADKTKIKQVLLNLLSNAIKFTAEKGRVYIRAYVAVDFILEVQDTGIGIAKEDLKKISQRFSQVENIYTRKNRGSGLGMSISKDIIELHGGKLTIESEPNVGTKITIRLPAERIIFGGQYAET